MNRFAIAVVAVGLALSTGLASQGRGSSGRGPSAMPVLVQPAGATQRAAGSYRSPGTEGATFEVTTSQSATAIEEHYRKQLAAAGWRMESSGSDANIAYSYFTIPVAGAVRAGTLIVTPMASGRFWLALRLVDPMPAPAPPAPKTESEMMDWMLRQLPRPAQDDPRSTASTLAPELLPAGFKRTRTLERSGGVGVAGTADNFRPSDISAFFAGLRKSGWSDRLRTWMIQNFVVAEFCKNDVRASFVFGAEPKRVVMAGISTDPAPHPGCEVAAKYSPGISGPIVVLPAAWSPAHVDGGGGDSHSRSGMRLSTTTPVAAIASEIESQIAATGYKVIARTGEANQRHVRFESTQSTGSPAIVWLSVTKLPWSPQIDAVYEVVTASRR